MRDWYNENNAYAAQWIRNLQGAKHLPAGEVDERSIVDVQAKDLKGVKQAHFFAGIGGWPLALRLAGWPEEREVWTGSCPCQPFSVAGKSGGLGDERHLWPAFRRLIAECRPPVIFGEQVASKDGRQWLAGVRTDLENLGYAVGAADLCAASSGEKVKGRICYEGGAFEWRPIVIGAPNIRQRLWWVAYAASSRWGPRVGKNDGRKSNADRRSKTGGLANSEDSNRRGPGKKKNIRGRTSKTRGPSIAGGMGKSDSTGSYEGSQASETARHGSTVDSAGGSRGLGDTSRNSMGGHPRTGTRTEAEGDQEGKQAGIKRHKSGHASPTGGLGDSNEQGPQGRGERGNSASERIAGSSGVGFWSDFDIIPCGDGKSRRIEPGTFPLAHGVPNRVGRLRAYGNAINPSIAAEFVKACMEAQLL